MNQGDYRAAANSLLLVMHKKRDAFGRMRLFTAISDVLMCCRECFVVFKVLACSLRQRGEVGTF